MKESHSEKKVLVFLISILIAFSTVFYAIRNTSRTGVLADEHRIENVFFDAADPCPALERLSETQGADVREEYRLTNCLDVAYGKVYKFQQMKDGMDVFGKELIISVNQDGAILSVNGQYLPVRRLEKPVLRESDIVDIVAAQKGIPVSVVNTIVYPMDGNAEIAYVAVHEEGKMQYVVSAIDGDILRSFPSIEKAPFLCSRRMQTITTWP